MILITQSRASNMATSFGNEPSVCFRLAKHNMDRSALVGQRKHDQRRGDQPKYVDTKRTHLNRTLHMTPGYELNGMQWTRFLDREEKVLADSRLKKTRGNKMWRSSMLSFSTSAQKLLGDYSPHKEAIAFYEGYCKRHDVRMLWLEVHHDEYAVHYHAMLTHIKNDGQALVLRPRDMKFEQDQAGVAFSHLGIKRGVAKLTRIERGETESTYINRTVKELHDDLPKELETAQAKVAEQAELLKDQLTKTLAMQAETNRLQDLIETLNNDRTKKEVFLANTEAKLEHAKSNEVTTASALATLDARVVTQTRRLDVTINKLTEAEVKLFAAQNELANLDDTKSRINNEWDLIGIAHAKNEVDRIKNIELLQVFGHSLTDIEDVLRNIEDTDTPAP